MTETTDFDAHKTRASDWFRSLRDEIVAAFEGLEATHATGPFSASEPGRFEVTPTTRSTEDGSDAGGGLMSVMRGGRVFEIGADFDSGRRGPPQVQKIFFASASHRS